jgi:hypothetical protein
MADLTGLDRASVWRLEQIRSGPWRSTALTLPTSSRPSHRPTGRLARADDPGLRALRGRSRRRLGLGLMAGPNVAVAHAAEDVDGYVETFEEFCAEVT